MIKQLKKVNKNNNLNKEDNDQHNKNFLCQLSLLVNCDLKKD
jgi:hypothetical protein